MSFYQIAKNTLRESLREPIFYLLLLTALAIIGFSPMMALFVFRDQSKLVCDTGLATTLVFSLVCSVLCASHTVTREMRNGTVLLLLSKPVPRWSFILAKIAGIITAMTIFVVACESAILVSIRVAKDQFELDWAKFYSFIGALAVASLYGAIRNYLHRKPFASSASTGMFVLVGLMAVVVSVLVPGAATPDDPVIAFSILAPVFVLLVLAVWLMVALTVALSTRLDMVANLTVVSIVFFLGLVSDYFFGASANTFSLGALCYALLPNWQLFWLADAIASRRSIPASYLLLAAVYAASYIAFLSFGAVMLFQQKEAGADTK